MEKIHMAWLYWYMTAGICSLYMSRHSASGYPWYTQLWMRACHFFLWPIGLVGVYLMWRAKRKAGEY